MTFSIGDVVKLKSGGPAMTVWGIREDNVLVETCWFAGEELKRDAFHQNELLDMADIARQQEKLRLEQREIEIEIQATYEREKE